MTKPHYDIIGDIHGCANTLRALLRTLSYVDCGGLWQHATRRAIFLGDFIDRGPLQREVLAIVRPMIERGSALSVMGNHEFNAIAYATPDGAGGHLREHSEKNHGQHYAFLEAYAGDSTAYDEAIAWFKTLPLWLEVDGLRVVHACWDQAIIDAIAAGQGGCALLGADLLHKSAQRGNWEYCAVETLLKGKEIPLANGNSFLDKDGHERHHIRVRWWDSAVTNYRDAFMGPASAATHIPDDDIDGDHLLEYASDSPPVFTGHYWLEGARQPLAANIACVDYSVGKPDGRLSAYRWDGEATLSAAKFVSVPRLETGKLDNIAS